MNLSTPQRINVGTKSTDTAQLSDNTLSLSGYGVVSVKPDRAKIQMTVSFEASTAQDAGAKNADIFSKLLHALQQAGISKENVETASYNITPTYYYPPKGGQAVLTGYRTDQSLVITVIPENIDQLGTKTGQVIDLAVGAGVKQVSRITFTVADNAYKTLQNQALVVALKDTDAQAKIIADTLGMRIVTVRSVSYGSQKPTPYLPPIRAFAKAEATAATEIIPSFLQVSANVQVVYLIVQA